ncbi:hypothetical protein X744_17065 [Mesorhizobium sp. LNJC372A00]|nr:hypothetical protein X744_17065 [Mesorhizobium sp. LNJC372A00]
MMLSDEELTEIDNWRYANRVATRSDAIRRLVEIGRWCDASIEEIDAASMTLIPTLTELSGQLTEIGFHSISVEKRDLFAQALIALSDSIAKAISQSIEIRELRLSTVEMRGAGEFEKASSQARLAKEAMSGVRLDQAVEQASRLATNLAILAELGPKK